MSKPILSKSTFLRGLQCEKSLWLYKNRYALKDEILPQQQAIFSQGTNVGVLAQDLFPGGEDATVAYYEQEKGVALTQRLINEGATIIYEAAFAHDGVYAAVDILVKDDQGWKAYEVKSSTKVSAVNIKDAAIQAYILMNSGIELTDIFIVHINNEYVKNGAIDVQELFTKVSVWDEIQNDLLKAPQQVKIFKNLLAQKGMPNIEIGTQCSDPYDCDFRGTCWKDIPDYSVFNISNLREKRKFELYNKSLITFQDLDLSTESFNPNHTLQIQSEISGNTFIDRERISGFLEQLTYPLYFLDFETINPSIPVYDQTRPYQQLVFQYSLHVQEKPNGPLQHFEYLAKADSDIDPRKGFVEQLITECGDSGDVIVYNIGFERSKLEDAVIQFPEYSAQLQNIISRLKDLMIPFQQKWYYTPAMKGSYSIKYVLPALVPELSYQDLEIQEGGTASLTFSQMVDGSFKGDVDNTRQALLDYCKLDTEAMVRILGRLYDSIN